MVSGNQHKFRIYNSLTFEEPTLFMIKRSHVILQDRQVLHNNMSRRAGGGACESQVIDLCIADINFSAATSIDLYQLNAG